MVKDFQQESIDNNQDEQIEYEIDSKFNNQSENASIISPIILKRYISNPIMNNNSIIDNKKILTYPISYKYLFEDTLKHKKNWKSLQKKPKYFEFLENIFENYDNNCLNSNIFFENIYCEDFIKMLKMCNNEINHYKECIEYINNLREKSFFYINNGGILQGLSNEEQKKQFIENSANHDLLINFKDENNSFAYKIGTTSNKGKNENANKFFDTTNSNFHADQNLVAPTNLKQPRVRKFFLNQNYFWRILFDEL